MARKKAVTGGENPACGEEKSMRGVELGMHDSDDNLWQLESSDLPGMVLVSTVLTGKNDYLVWSRFMTLALGAKGKLGFVNGEIYAPDEHSPNYGRWNQTDCMVFCWIINTLSKEIGKAFNYAETAKDLWDGIALVFGQRNSLMRYKMKREIMNATQGSDSVTLYFKKLCQLWGELEYLFPLPVCKCGECNCGAEKTAAKYEMTEKLMQFLMGLDESFDSVRQQILLMDPLPDVYEAHSSVLLVEELRNTGKPGDNWNSHKGKGKVEEEKVKLQCDYCKGPGHEKKYAGPMDTRRRCIEQGTRSDCWDWKASTQIHQHHLPKFCKHISFLENICIGASISHHQYCDFLSYSEAMQTGFYLGVLSILLLFELIHVDI